MSLKLLKIQGFVQIFNQVSRDALPSTVLNVNVKTIFNRWRFLSQSPRVYNLWRGRGCRSDAISLNQDPLIISKLEPQFQNHLCFNDFISLTCHDKTLLKWNIKHRVQRKADGVQWLVWYLDRLRVFSLDGICSLLSTDRTQRGIDWICAFTIKQTNLKREAIKMCLPKGSFQGNVLKYFTDKRLAKLGRDSQLQFSTFG